MRMSGEEPVLLFLLRCSIHVMCRDEILLVINGIALRANRAFLEIVCTGSAQDVITMLPFLLRRAT